MNYIDYASKSAFQRTIFKTIQGFKNLPKNIGNGIIFLGKAILGFLLGIVFGIKNYFLRFIRGDFATKISFVIMGFGNIVRGQIIKGILLLAIEFSYILFMINFGWGYLQMFPTLGLIQQKSGLAECNILVNGDNSMHILLYSVMTILISIAVFFIYVASTKMAYKVETDVKEGRKPASFISEFRDLFDKRYHTTLLTYPIVMISVFLIIPLIFMILIAFTNFDSNHQPQAYLFQWVGTQNFHDILGGNPLKAYTFKKLTEWTFVWAIIATFSNYILGMILALMINKKGIKCKSLFRTMFVLTIAVPQFVTLLFMNQMLQDTGIVNTLLQSYGITHAPIQFLDKVNSILPKATVLIVNLWVGIPYTILITSGILMNIPEELYESARIDGASPFKTFTKITLPYMLFVTTPYLITQFVGNLNNFNVIYLLTNGGPATANYYQAGQTDLLVTWLFKLTTVDSNFKLAATIGIIVFIICAAFTLITFNMSKSARNEEEFS
ncbi:MAG: sugar ABC transporter permease [Bacillota bacterium]|nr:sugar ABC transporter permease [Bacillota bacterium]